jgi:hypothetical protein
MPIHDNLSGRAAELAHLTDLIRTSLSLADAAIPLLRRRFAELEDDLATAGQRMAREKDDARYEALARAFDEMKTEREGGGPPNRRGKPAVDFLARRLDLIAAESATAAHDDYGVSLDTPHNKQGAPACCRGPSVEPGAEGGDGTGDGRTDEPISGMVPFRTVSNVGATRFERATSTSRT